MCELLTKIPNELIASVSSLAFLLLVKSRMFPERFPTKGKYENHETDLIPTGSLELCQTFPSLELSHFHQSTDPWV